MRVKLILSYDGTDFCGWQKQLHAQKPSIQETLELALARIFKEPITCVASGRTDSGVHAFGQVVHFDAPSDPRRIHLVKALRPLLPQTMVVKSSMIVSSQFHSLFSATAKTYRYVVSTQNTGMAFMGRYCHWYRYPFDFSHLNELSQVFEGTHDFKSFQSVGTPISNTVRTVYRSQWIQKKHHLFYYEVTGQGFLKQMVRNMVGTQLFFMQKKRSPEDLHQLLLARDRRLASYTAPPQGLFLVKVYYRRP